METKKKKERGKETQSREQMQQKGNNQKIKERSVKKEREKETSMADVACEMTLWILGVDSENNNEGKIFWSIPGSFMQGATWESAIEYDSSAGHVRFCCVARVSLDM